MELELNLRTGRLGFLLARREIVSYTRSIFTNSTPSIEWTTL